MVFYEFSFRFEGSHKSMDRYPITEYVIQRVATITKKAINTQILTKDLKIVRFSELREDKDIDIHEDI